MSNLKTYTFKIEHPLGDILNVDGAVIDDAGFAVKVKFNDGELKAYKFDPQPTAVPDPRNEDKCRKILSQLASAEYYDYMRIKRHLSEYEAILEECAPAEQRISGGGSLFENEIVKTQKALEERTLNARLRRMRMKKMSYSALKQYVDMARKSDESRSGNNSL